MIAALRRGIGVAVIRASIYPIERRQLDKDRVNEPLKRNPNYGIDRVLMVFDRDKYGTISPELAFINVAAFTGALVGALSNGIKTAHYDNSYFRETNEITLFHSQRDAGRKLLDKTTVGFGRGAVRGGIRFGLFCFSFSAISTLISKYRDKTSVMEYSVAGLITGTLFKFSLGPKGMISGGFFGILLGTVCGAAIVAATKLTGCTMQDAYDVAHSYFRGKDRFFYDAERTQADFKDVIFYYESAMDKLDDLDDLKSEAELKFNHKNLVKLKTSIPNQVVHNEIDTKIKK